MSSAWVITEQHLGCQDIDVTDTVQRHGLGSIVRARHATYGVAEFVYLQGAASTAVSDVVTYLNGASTRLAATTAVGPVAVAMSANIANQYGWYCVSGTVPVKTNGGVAAGAQAYAAATAAVDDAVVAGEAITGMFFAETVGSAGIAKATLQRPTIA